jgi:hypothetical protein
VRKTFEVKRSKLEFWLKLAAALVAGFLVSPFIIVAVQGLLGLGLAVAVTVTLVQIAPWFARKVANWKLKALKAEAERNPIEHLQNDYMEQDRLLQNKAELIKQFATEVEMYKTFLDKEGQFFPKTKEQGLPRLARMQQALELKRAEWKQAARSVELFGTAVREADSMYRAGLAALKVEQLAQIQMKDRILQDTLNNVALDSVYRTLATSMASLDNAVMLSIDEPQALSEFKQPTVQQLELLNREPVPQLQGVSVKVDNYVVPNPR